MMKFDALLLAGLLALGAAASGEEKQSSAAPAAPATPATQAASAAPDERRPFRSPFLRQHAALPSPLTKDPSCAPPSVCGYPFPRRLQRARRPSRQRPDGASQSHFSHLCRRKPS